MKWKFIFFLFITNSYLVLAQETMIQWRSPEGSFEGYEHRITDDNYVFIHLVVYSPEELEGQDFELWTNGKKAVDGDSMDLDGFALQEGQSYDGKFINYRYINKILLQEGQNKVVLNVQVDNEWVASPTMNFIYEMDKPNLHIYSIGIPYQEEEYALKYTQSDALAFAKAFENQEGKLFDKVNITTINTPEETTKQALGDFFYDDLYNDYAIKEKIGKDDVLIIYISSHGFSLNNDSTKFRITGSDFNFMRPKAKSIGFNDIIEALEELHFAQPIIFLDACHSGAVINDYNTKKITSDNSFTESISKLSKSGDYPIFAACGYNQKTYENEAWGHSAFTTALLEAFRGQSNHGRNVDKNGDNLIDMRELYDYVKYRVPILVKTMRPTPRLLQTPRISEAALRLNLPIFSLE